MTELFFKMQKCKITSCNYKEIAYILQQLNVAYTRCMRATGFK